MSYKFKICNQMSYKFKICNQCNRPVTIPSYSECDQCINYQYNNKLYKYSRISYKFLVKRSKNIKKFKKFSFNGEHDEWLYRKY